MGNVTHVLGTSRPGRGMRELYLGFFGGGICGFVGKS